MKKLIRKIVYRHGNITIKHVEDMTPEEIAKLREQVIRATLHQAVDMGLFDNKVREVKGEEVDLGEKF